MKPTLEVQHDARVQNKRILEIEDWTAVRLPSTLNSTWLPINPVRTPSGAWVSLAKVVGEAQAKPVPLPPNEPMNAFSVVATQIDLSLAAKLGIGSIFSGTLNYNDRAFYLDASAYTDRYAETPGAFVFGTRWGVGLRVLLHVSEIKAGLSLDFGLVGAAVQLRLAKALYEIDGIGIGIDGMQVVLGEVHGVGNFGDETYYKINDSVIPKLAEYLKKHEDKLTPQPYQVQVIQPFDIDPISAAKPILFAMHRLHDGCTLNEAIANAAGKYDKGEIKSVYDKLAPGLAPNDEPGDNAREMAGQWLKGN